MRVGQLQKKHLYVPLSDHIIRLSTQSQHVGALFSRFMRVTWHPLSPKLPVALNVQTGLAISIDLKSPSSTAPFLPTQVARLPKGDALNMYLIRTTYPLLSNPHPCILCEDFQALRLPIHHRSAAPQRATRSTSTSCACASRAGTWSPPYAASRSAGATWTLTCRVSDTHWVGVDRPADPTRPQPFLTLARLVD